MCLGGSILAPVQQLIKRGMLDSASRSLPPSSACFFLSSLNSVICFSLTKGRREGVILPSNVTFTLIKHGIRFENDTCFHSL